MNLIIGIFNTPRGIRIPVTSVKGRCPRPLDDGGFLYIYNNFNTRLITCQYLLKKMIFNFLRLLAIIDLTCYPKMKKLKTYLIRMQMRRPLKQSSFTLIQTVNKMNLMQSRSKIHDCHNSVMDHLI